MLQLQGTMPVSTAGVAIATLRIELKLQHSRWGIAISRYHH